MQAIYDIEEECKKENPNAERFYKRLEELDKEWNTNWVDYYKKQNYILGNIYDPAHIISRSQCPALSSEKLNIEVLPRIIHTYIDSYYEVFSTKHEQISKERQIEIWKLLIGEERYNELLFMKNNIEELDIDYD